MYETAGLRCGRALRCAYALHELFAVEGLARKNLAVLDEDRVAIALRVFLFGCCNRSFAELATRSSTAMRTATPFVTCSVITERGPSATAPSISMPRFIGPGCMTMTSGFAILSLSVLTP